MTLAVYNLIPPYRLSAEGDGYFIQTIMAQVGHVSPQMMKTYSHIRRQALNAAAAALEPNFLKPAPQEAEMIN